VLFLCAHRLRRRPPPTSEMQRSTILTLCLLAIFALSTMAFVPASTTFASRISESPCRAHADD
jgi:hypothetical protein